MNEPQPPSASQGHPVTVEGLNLLYQRLGQSIHAECEAMARAADRERRLTEAMRLVQAGQPGATPPGPTEAEG